MSKDSSNITSAEAWYFLGVVITIALLFIPATAMYADLSDETKVWFTQRSFVIFTMASGWMIFAILKVVVEMMIYQYKRRYSKDPDDE